MGTVLNDDQPGAFQRLIQLKEKCTLEVKNGLTLDYDHKDKVIVSSENPNEKAEVFVVVNKTEKGMLIILPYKTAMDFYSLYLEPKCKIPIPFDFKTKLREYQEKDVVRITNQMEKEGCCYFCAYPGYGKTVIMAFMIFHFGLKAIIVVPSLTLVNQTFDALKKYLPQAKIFIMDTNRKIPDDAQIVISYRGRLNGTSAPLKPFEFLILDEVHMLSTHIGIAGIMTCQPTKILALTATPGDRNNITELFVGKCKIQSLTDKTWYVAFPNVYSGLDTSDYKGVTGYTDAINALTECHLYVESTVNMVFYFLRIKQRVIIITMRQQLRDRLAKAINAIDPSVKVGVLGTKSRKCGNCDVIIGTHKFIGTGFDPANAITDFDEKPFGVVFMCGSLKDKTLMYQIAGRSFRNNDYCISVFPRISDLGVSNSHTDKLNDYVDTMESCIHLNEFEKFLESFVVKTGSPKNKVISKILEECEEAKPAPAKKVLKSKALNTTKPKATATKTEDKPVTATRNISPTGQKYAEAFADWGVKSKPKARPTSVSVKKPKQAPA